MKTRRTRPTKAQRDVTELRRFLAELRRDAPFLHDDIAAYEGLLRCAEAKLKAEQGRN